MYARKVNRLAVKLRNPCVMCKYLKYFCSNCFVGLLFDQTLFTRYLKFGNTLALFILHRKVLKKMKGKCGCIKIIQADFE